MKIALITIHNISNYGSALQAFATKKILSQYGDVETIDYFDPQPGFKLVLIRFDPSIQGIKWIIHDFLRLKDRYKLVKKFKKFIESNLNLTRLVTRREIQNGVLNYFDVYVCGSDQIWHPGRAYKRGRKGGQDPIYFLSFANKKAKKISYASSMGGHYRLTDSEKVEVKDLLKDFTAISVRENGAQKLLSKLLEREVFHLLDPTLLLTKEEWFDSLKIDKSYRSIKEDYILVYRVAKTPLMKKVTEFFVKKFGIKVVILDQTFKSFINADVHIKDAGPLEFIELFANANFIITDSFHGTCFSVNFKKSFVSIAPKRRDRIESLLNLLGLKDRLIDEEKNLHKLSADFNYEVSENKLKEERAKAVNFLKSSVV